MVYVQMAEEKLDVSKSLKAAYVRNADSEPDSALQIRRHLLSLSFQNSDILPVFIFVSQ